MGPTIADQALVVEELLLDKVEAMSETDAERLLHKNPLDSNISK